MKQNITLKFEMNVYFSVCYVIMEPFAGTIGSIMIYFITAHSAKLVALDTQVYDMPIWKVALAVHIVCWILQFIGHGVFEGML